MAIQIELRQRADIDAVFQLTGDFLAERTVQAVNALDDEHLIPVHPEPNTLFKPPLRFERIQRQLHLAPGQQLHQLVVEQLHVDGFQTFEIGLAIRAEGDVLAVFIIIIQ